MAAKSGQAIGEAAAKEKAEQEAQRMQEIQLARSWELKKMQMNSEQDFAHELRLRQAELDREARAHEWETEKMELRSRFDFEQEEKERIHRKGVFNSGIEVIDNNEGLTDEQKNAAKFRLAERYTDIEEAGQYLGTKPLYKENESDLGGYIKGLMQGEQPTEAMTETVAQSGQVYVTNKATGVSGVIPVEELEEAIASGDYELIQGQTVPKSEAFRKYQSQYLVEEKFPQLSSDIAKYSNIFRGKPGKYFGAKGELSTLASKYPYAYEQYLENIRKSRQGNK